MIAHIRGKLFSITPSHAIIECAGLGYHVHISLQTYSQIQDAVVGQEVFLHTLSIYREDSAQLFGFSRVEERSLFLMLTGVSGVGLVSALILLSTFSLEELSSAIANGNHTLIQKAKGIGLKTAQRIIIDLKDKILTFQPDIDDNATFVTSSTKSEAMEALAVLGIPPKAAEKLADKFVKENPEISVEHLIKNILKSI